LHRRAGNRRRTKRTYLHVKLHSAAKIAPDALAVGGVDRLFKVVLAVFEGFLVLLEVGGLGPVILGGEVGEVFSIDKVRVGCVLTRVSRLKPLGKDK
jgi:hypothetical protein